MDSDNEFEAPVINVVNPKDLINNLQEVVNDTANLVAETV